LVWDQQHCVAYIIAYNMHLLWLYFDG